MIVFAKVSDAFFQQHFGSKTKFCRPGDGLAYVVRLRCPLGNHDIGVFRQRIGQQEFQLTGLISATGKPCCIIAFDPYFRTTQ